MRFKKVKALMMAGVLALTTVMTVPMAAVAAQSHVNPHTGGQCDNTYFNYVEKSVTSVYVMSPHQLTDGKKCNRTRLSYSHDKICSSCTATLETYCIFQCTETHSICVDPEKTCKLSN